MFFWNATGRPKQKPEGWLTEKKSRQERMEVFWFGEEGEKKKNPPPQKPKKPFGMDHLF